MKKDIKEFIRSNRHQFRNAPFGKEDAAANPFTQFDHWFENAVKAEISDPYAITLATASSKGVPSARVVYMRDISEDGLVFYTNYLSNKGRELEENPMASANFYWEVLSRQIRFTGSVEKVSAEISDAYFNSRPRASQIGAWASHQSHLLAGRNELMKKVEILDSKFADKKVPRPDFWGGFILKPDTVEFWQGRENRLHDRIFYDRTETGSWKLIRLSP